MEVKGLMQAAITAHQRSGGYKVSAGRSGGVRGRVLLACDVFAVKLVDSYLAKLEPG